MLRSCRHYYDCLAWLSHNPTHYYWFIFKKSECCSRVVKILSGRVIGCFQNVRNQVYISPENPNYIDGLFMER